ncbi:MAG TPA: hypothetical protein VFJ58_30110 [Armatimonadota bacterium]|nr:hypothetical protein [Armatimonadota bacterium]
MTATVVGVFKGGKLELLEEPQGLRDGRVRVTIEEEPARQPTVANCDRRAFLRLPLSERRRVLKEQAEKIVTHYEADTEWREWLDGDVVEN